MQQKFAKRDGGSIDRSQDIARLQEFYKQYREKHKVDELREDEMKLRESGVFSGNLGEYVPLILSSLKWHIGVYRPFSCCKQMNKLFFLDY